MTVWRAGQTYSQLLCDVRADLGAGDPVRFALDAVVAVSRVRVTARTVQGTAHGEVSASSHLTTTDHVFDSGLIVSIATTF